MSKSSKSAKTKIIVAALAIVMAAGTGFSVQQTILPETGIIANAVGDDLVYNNMTYSVYGDEITITGYTGMPTAIKIPAIIDGKKVIDIANNAFENCTSITSVSIGNNVTYIGSDAFKKCPNITSITFGSSVKRIENSAFQNCLALDSVTFPASLKTIDNYAFNGCTGLKTVKFSSFTDDYGNYKGISSIGYQSLLRYLQVN